MHPFYDFLEQRLQHSLPGQAAQKKMAPVPLNPDMILPQKKSATARPSSVMILLFPDETENEDLRVILTLRTKNIRHAGQISFPGGRKEKNESALQTALRETEEEIGIHASEIRLAGSITPLFVHKSDNIVTPFIGFLPDKPKLEPDPREVEEAFSVPLDRLLSRDALIREEWTHIKIPYDVPFWSVHRVPLWGATAMITSELMELYREFRSVRSTSAVESSG